MNVVAQTPIPPWARGDYAGRAVTLEAKLLGVICKARLSPGRPPMIYGKELQEQDLSNLLIIVFSKPNVPPNMDWPLVRWVVDVAAADVDADLPTALALSEQIRKKARDEQAALDAEFAKRRVTPEARFIGLCVRHNVDPEYFPITPENFSEPDLRDLFRVLLDVPWLDRRDLIFQAKRDAHKPRCALFLWLYNVAGEPDRVNQVDPWDEIDRLAKQIRKTRLERPAPLVEPKPAAPRRPEADARALSAAPIEPAPPPPRPSQAIPQMRTTQRVPSLAAEEPLPPPPTHPEVSPAPAVVEEQPPQRQEPAEIAVEQECAPAEEKPAPEPRPLSRRPRSSVPPKDTKAYACCLGVQQKNLGVALRLKQDQRRERGEPFLTREELLRHYGINLNVLYETDELGRRIGWTAADDEFVRNLPLDRRPKGYVRLGKTVTLPAQRFLPRITPGTETREETHARRARVTREHRTTGQRERRVKQNAVKAELRQRVGDLDCRTSAVWEALPDDWATIKELAHPLKRVPAFKGLKGQPLINGILKALAAEPLKQRVERDMRIGKFRQPVLYVRRKAEKEGN